MARDPLSLLPLKDLTFRILLILVEGERHGWSLVKELEQADGTRVLPGHFYRTISAMVDEGLVDERDEPTATHTERVAQGAAPRRFFRMTSFGRTVVRAEAARLESLVQRSRASRLLRRPGTGR